VPEPLQAIALKAMERNPADRYQSALDMKADLLRYLDGRSVLRVRRSTPRRSASA
jgi:serine/threonine-protein kinase